MSRHHGGLGWRVLADKERIEELRAAARDALETTQLWAQTEAMGNPEGGACAEDFFAAHFELRQEIGHALGI